MDWDLVNHPTMPTVYNATLTIQRNGVLQGTFTANASSNKTINIPVPTTASDVSALPSSTKYGASLNMTLNSSTYVLTIQLKDQDGNNLGEAKTVDLPLESMVTGGSYDNSTKKITLTQQSGGNVEIAIGDIISGLQPAINASNKLSADYISDGTTNKVYTATEKTKLNGIQTGAEVNVQSDWNVVDNTSDTFIKNKPTIGNGTLTIWQNQTSKGTFTANQNTASDITITVPTKTSDLTNDSGFLNGNSKLNALQDVSITSASNNQSLVYENGMWKNKTLQSVTSLQELTDTSVSPTKTGEIITYNETTQKWTNTTGVLDCNFVMYRDTESTDPFPMCYYYTCDKSIENIQYAFEHKWAINTFVDTSVIGADFDNTLRIYPVHSILDDNVYSVIFKVEFFIFPEFMYYYIMYNPETEHWHCFSEDYTLTSGQLRKLKDFTLNGLDDTSISQTVTEGQVLTFDGTNWVNGYPNTPVSITYSELVTLRNNSNLVPNTTYRITDYVTEINPYITNMIYYMPWIGETQLDREIARVSPDYIQYDILVTAIDASHLSEDCRMVPHSGVTFFDNYYITSWKLKYTIDNDVERFDWAKNYYNVTLTLDDTTVNGVMIKTKAITKVSNVDYDTYLFFANHNGTPVSYMMYMTQGHVPSASETVYIMDNPQSITISSATQVLGKGVVYGMEDCFSNKLCYDYLNIQYKLYAITDVTANDSDLNGCLSELKTALSYNASGTKARLASLVSTVNPMGNSAVSLTVDSANYDWYYTFDMYDETLNKHTNVFYLCDNVTSEKSMSSCWIMYGLGPETWNLPYNVFQFNKAFLNGIQSSYGMDTISLQRQIFLHSLDLSEYVYGNVWYYDDMIVQNDDLGTYMYGCVTTPRHVFGTIFSNTVSVNADMCFFGKIVNSSLVYIKVGNGITTCNVHSAEIGMGTSYSSFINVENLKIGNWFNGYVCNCRDFYTGNNDEVKFIGIAGMVSDVFIGDRNYNIHIIFDGNITTDPSWGICIGNGVGYVSILNGDKFTGVIRSLNIGNNCNDIQLKNNCKCEKVTIEPYTENIILTSEGISNNDYLTNVRISNLYDIGGYYSNDSNLTTDFVTERFIIPHKIGRNSSGVVVCYVEEDLVAPAAYAPNGVTYTVSGNNITFTIPSGYTMCWTLDGRNPSKAVGDGVATTSATVTLTDGQTIKYISYNSSLPKDRWATQIYSYTHHVNAAK